MVIDATKSEGFEELEPLTEPEIRTLAERLEEVLRVLFCSLILSLCAGGLSYGMEIRPDDAVRAIMGEARGESYLGKVAIAEAVRARGTLKGVYGFKAKFSEPDRVWDEARRAWEESKKTNLTKGATVWGNKSDVAIFKKTRWFKSYELTAQIGGHYFFRLKRGAR